MSESKVNIFTTHLATLAGAVNVINVFYHSSIYDVIDSKIERKPRTLKTLFRRDRPPYEVTIRYTDK